MLRTHKVSIPMETFAFPGWLHLEASKQFERPLDYKQGERRKPRGLIYKAKPRGFGVFGFLGFINLKVYALPLNYLLFPPFFKISNF